MPVIVNYATTDGTAIAGQDYQASSGTLTFTPGQTSRSFSVSILAGALDGKTIHLALSAPANATLGTPASAVLTIQGNAHLPLLHFSQADYGVGEGAGMATITVSLSASASATVTVQYATSDGTAMAGQDYAATMGALTFTPGETSKQFAIPITQDAQDEPDEVLNLALSNPNNANLGGPDAAILTISDDDDAPLVQFSSAVYTTSVDGQGGVANIDVTLSAASSKPITVTYTTSASGVVASGVAQTGVLYFAPGETKQTISLQILPGDLVEGQSALLVHLADPVNATIGLADATLKVVRTEQHQIFLPLVVNNP
jgi:hypothetical protein